MKTIEKIAYELSDSPEEAEIVSFGLTQLVILIVGLSAAMIVGFLMGMPLETIVLILLLFPLRQNAGGFHASGRIKCAIISGFIFMALLLIIKYAHLNIVGDTILFIIGSLMLLLFAPVGNKNKPLDEDEVRVYGMRTVVIWIIESFLFVILEARSIFPWATIVSLSILVCGALVAIGKLQNYIMGNAE